jgi:predicted dehydrogenase
MLMVKSLLVVGCGSIGQRHAKNAKVLGVKDLVLCDIDSARVRKFADSIGTDLVFESYEKAFESHPEIDAAIIATPSCLHVQPAMYFAGHNVNILIEKPLSDTLEGTSKLTELARRKGIVSMMGTSYRFHEGFLALKNLLDSDEIGRLLHVSYLSGQYLPDWHPGTDYRKEYAAQKKLGGGVLLTNMSHGFDIVQWLFGNITRLQGWKTKLSDLDLDVEDSIFCLIKTSRNIIIQCQADFLQRDSRHQMTIVGEKGHVEVDFMKNQIRSWTIERKETRTTNYQFDTNKRYVEELKHFFSLIDEKKTDHDLDLAVGRRVLELIISKNIIQI